MFRLPPNQVHVHVHVHVHYNKTTLEISLPSIKVRTPSEDDDDMDQTGLGFVPRKYKPFHPFNHSYSFIYWCYGHFIDLHWRMTNLWFMISIMNHKLAILQSHHTSSSSSIWKDTVLPFQFISFKITNQGTFKHHSHCHSKIHKNHEENCIFMISNQ